MKRRKLTHKLIEYWLFFLAGIVIGYGVTSAILSNWEVAALMLICLLSIIYTLWTCPWRVKEVHNE